MDELMVQWIDELMVQWIDELINGTTIIEQCID